MKYLLDTHAFLWYANGDAQLSVHAKNIIDNLDNENELYLSIASVWEMAIKVRTQKLLIPNFENTINNQIVINDYKLLYIKIIHTSHLIEMPFHHKDPFDRIIIAQCLVEDLTIISCDSDIAKYDGIKIIW